MIECNFNPDSQIKWEMRSHYPTTEINYSNNRVALIWEAEETQEEILLNQYSNEALLIQRLNKILGLRIAIFFENNYLRVFVPTHTHAVYYIISHNGIVLAEDPRRLLPYSNQKINSRYVLVALTSHPTRRPPYDSILSDVYRMAPGGIHRIDPNSTNREKHASFSWAYIGRNKIDIPHLAEQLKSTLKEFSSFAKSQNKSISLEMSGGLDSAILAVALNKADIPFVANHYTVNKTSKINAIKLSKFLSFNLKIQKWDKLEIDFSHVTKKGSRGIISGTRPRSLRSYSAQDQLILNGQNADALASIHDYNFSFTDSIKNFSKKSVYKVYKEGLKFIGRTLLTDAIRNIILYRDYFKNKYLIGLIAPERDVCYPMILKNKKNYSDSDIEYKMNNVVNLTEFSGYSTFDIKLVRWLEYANLSQENKSNLIPRSYLPFSSGHLFIEMMNNPINIKSISSPKYYLFDLFNYLTKEKWSEIVVTGRTKFSGTKGLKSPDNLNHLIQKKLKNLNWELIYNKTDSYIHPILDDIRHNKKFNNNSRQIDKVGAVIAIDSFLKEM